MTDLVSLRLEPDIRKRLDALAVATERSRAAIAAEAVKQYIDLQEWQIAAIKKVSSRRIAVNSSITPD